MLELNKIQELLKDRKPRVVADATGLAYDTVLRVQKGKIKSVSYDVVKRISDYLEGVSAGGES